jgi:hypothetical protein
MLKNFILYVYCSVFRLRSVDISEEHVASIFRALLPTLIVLVLCLAYPLTLKMGWHILQNGRFTFNGLQGVMSLQPPP